MHSRGDHLVATAVVVASGAGGGDHHTVGGQTGDVLGLGRTLDGVGGTYKKNE